MLGFHRYDIYWQRVVYNSTHSISERENTLRIISVHVKIFCFKKNAGYDNYPFPKLFAIDV